MADGDRRERTRQKVADEDEFAGDGSRVIVDVGGMEIAVFRAEGDYYAMGNYCVHQGGPLCEGGLNGRVVSDDDGWDWRYEEEAYYIHCPWHGWIFDIRDGANVNAERYRAPTYDVEVEDGEVFVLR